jgi:hypothetical protein
MTPLLVAALGGSPDDAQKAFFAVGFLSSAFAVGTAGIVSLLGILYMTMVVAPNATQRFSGALREHNLKSFLAGIGVTVGFVLILAVARRSPGLSLLFLTLICTALIPAFAATSEDIGRRLFWACGKEGSRASHLAAGWLVFAFGSLFPILGWFVIFPYVGISGLGSLVIGALSSPRPAAPSREIEFPEEK